MTLKTPQICLRQFVPGVCRSFVIPNGNAPWKTILRRDPCAYCGGPGGTVDHIIPRRGGGRGYRRRLRGYCERWGWHMNLTGACQDCNQKKGCKPLLQFLLTRT